MKKNLLAFILILTYIFPSALQAQMVTKRNSPALRAALGITAKQMSDYLHFIASDEMEGRDTPSRGLDTTAKFIGMNLSRWGFRPAGDDGTFYQKIALQTHRTDSAKTSLEIGGKKLEYGVDYFSDPNAAIAADSPLVFVGTGWLLKSRNVDSLKDLDVKGKTVVFYRDGFPPGYVEDRDTGKLGKFGTDWLDGVAYAMRKGAVGVIRIATPGIDTNWESERASRENTDATVDKFPAGDDHQIPTMMISRKTAENLLAGESKTLAEITNGGVPGFALSKTAKYTVEVKSEKATTQNVVAIWEGSDPVLKNEMVAVGAHYDHLGTGLDCGMNNGADRICNGADDDGSGTTGILAIAEALAMSKVRPKRSTLFVWHCGEEKGLWGSQYFTTYPTVDLKNVIAQLNIDMIGRSKKAGDTDPKDKDLTGESAIYIVGSEKMSSQLGKTVADVNNTYLKLNYDKRYDDPNDPNHIFFRSDHFNYAKKLIPITFWYDGEHVDYHQAGDEPDRIDYNKMEKVTRTIFLTMWELSDTKDRPKIDKQLPPEITGVPTK
jgi:hypothetical protein